MTTLARRPGAKTCGSPKCRHAASLLTSADDARRDHRSDFRSPAVLMSPDFPHLESMVSLSVQGVSDAIACEKPKQTRAFLDIKKVRPPPGGGAAAREPGLGTGRGGDVTGVA
jgi:hypothetical protein